MIKGITKTGFVYEISEKRMENYELMEYLEELDENPLVITKVVKLLLGDKHTKLLKDHLRDDEGFVSSEKLSKEILDIFESQKQIKNS